MSLLGIGAGVLDEKSLIKCLENSHMAISSALKKDEEALLLVDLDASIDGLSPKRSPTNRTMQKVSLARASSIDLAGHEMKETVEQHQKSILEIEKWIQLRHF